MSARSITLYVEPKTLKRLRLAIKLYPSHCASEETMQNANTTTADELGNRLINEMIDDKFPLVKGLEKAIAKTEKEYLERNKQQ